MHESPLTMYFFYWETDTMVMGLAKDPVDKRALHRDLVRIRQLPDNGKYDA